MKTDMITILSLFTTTAILFFSKSHDEPMYFIWQRYAKHLNKIAPLNGTQ